MTSPSDGGPAAPLTGQRALVTGGGDGIGRATCLALARAGAKVAPLGRRRAPLEAVAAEIATGGWPADAVRPCVADVRVWGEMAGVAALLEEAWGGVDILVTAAGLARFSDVLETDPADWAEQIAVNLTGSFHAVRAFLPGMVRRGRGHIVTIGSVASVKTFTGNGAYSASKFGVLGFSRVLREEVRANGVRVTTVLPGATATPLWGPDPPAPPERMMSAESVAEAVRGALTADPRTLVEEILLRPVLGDL